MHGAAQASAQASAQALAGAPSVLQSPGIASCIEAWSQGAAEGDPAAAWANPARDRHNSIKVNARRSISLGSDQRSLRKF